MWLSRKINSMLKQQYPKKSSSPYKKKEQQHHHISFVLAVTSSVNNNTGKSSLIQCLGLEEIHNRNPTTLLGKLYRLKNNQQFIIQIIEYNGIPPKDLDILDGVFICYDTTNNRDSVYYLSAITNAFVSQHIPCLLIGLSSDLTVSRTVDPGHLIGNRFGVQVIGTDNYTVNGIQLLKQQFIQFIYTDRKVLLQHQQPSVAAGDEVAIPPPTIIMKDCILPIDQQQHNTNKSATVTIRSRSSSCSTAASSGETTSAIVDEVLNNYQDENIMIIFLTVFRKFMRPLELVNILIQRFESLDDDDSSNDSGDTSEHKIPTKRQERIRSLFFLWLSNYWGDFKSLTTCRILIEFLERISSSYPTIYYVLLPLAIREPVTTDKDQTWGLCDDDDELAEKQPTTKQQRKKDSGYCESFGDYWIPSPTLEKEHSLYKPEDSLFKSEGSSLMKRAASTSSHHNRIPASFKHIVSLATDTTTDNNNTPRRNSSPILPTSNTTSTASSAAIFGGGIISADDDSIEQKLILDMMTSISASKIAQQLTWIEAELFQKIQPRDFLRHLWTQNQQQKRKTSSSSNPVLTSVEHFNFVSGWIASLVVNQSILEKRIFVFKYCLQIAVELKSLNNFNTLMAVLAGVNSAAVLRLKQTRETTRLKNKKLYHEFLELESLMSSERSFYNYRSTLKQTQLPGIPYLGIHQQDLVSLGEANKDHKTDGKVHWKKFRLMGESILEMTRFQYPTYHLLEPDPSLLYFIRHESTISTEDERYEKSQEIEPRLIKPSLSTNSSTNSITTITSRWLLSKS